MKRSNKDDNRVLIAIRIPRELNRAIDIKAAEMQICKQEIVRRAIVSYLDSLDPLHREIAKPSNDSPF